MYMCTPEYMAEYAKRFFEKGARIVGGCCGTAPAHIAEMVKAVRALDRAQTTTTRVTRPRIEVSEPIDDEGGPALADKSALGRKLAAGEQISTIEITPPRGVDLNAFLTKARLCATQGVNAINIPDGPRASSRMSPLVAACKIQQEVSIETICISAVGTVT